MGTMKMTRTVCGSIASMEITWRSGCMPKAGPVTGEIENSIIEYEQILSKLSDDFTLRNCHFFK